MLRRACEWLWSEGGREPAPGSHLDMHTGSWEEAFKARMEGSSSIPCGQKNGVLDALRDQLGEEIGAEHVAVK